MNATMNHEAAQDAYAAAHAECMGYLEALRAKLEDADAPSDMTRWGHVGDMAHLADQLRKIVEPT